jgi:N-acyl-D-aspartate/D-glutamate deacylase
VTARTVSVLLGFQTFHPFSFTTVWGQSGIGLLPWSEQVQRVQNDADLRARLVSAARHLEQDSIVQGFMAPARTYLLGDPPNYEPSAAQSVAGIAAARGRDVWETFLDLLLQDEGRELLNAPVLNYSDGDLEATRTMLVHPATVFGLGDGGAHAGQTCDASTTTFMLSYWARDRRTGRIPLEEAVRLITSSTAELYGLGDRGRLVPGCVGDVNVIDQSRIGLHRPELVHDLPGGARRLIQRAEGYLYTVKSGQVTRDGGESTGACPGALLRGAR